MIRKRDVQWWVLEAEKHPESATTIIQELAARLIELDEQNERLRNQIIRLRRRAPAVSSSTRVKALQEKVEALQTALRSQDLSEPSLVLLSDQAIAARIPLSLLRDMALQGHPILDARAALRLVDLLVASPHDELLLLTSQGRGLKRMLAEVPPLAKGGPWSASPGANLAEGERLTAAAATGAPPRFWTVVTRQGYVQRFVRVALERHLAQSDQLLKSPFHNDCPIAIVNGDRGDLLLVTRWGRAVRFSQRTIETQGSVALELGPGDEVADAVALPDEGEILIVTASGAALRRETSHFSARSRPGGGGKALIQARDVLSIHAYSLHAELLYVTYAGNLVLLSLADVPLSTRADKGIDLCDLSRDPAVSATLVPAS
jgi:DNA gyrase/topoisomerase IV subunit A